MPLINHVKMEINAKLVFFGPASAGKATSLHYIYSKLKEGSRGKLKSMDLQKDKMLFFDFLPSTQGSVNGYTIRFHLYTLSGRVNHPSSWKMVLKGIDGLVFVLDSRQDGMAANAESLAALNASLGSMGKTLADFPCILQCNKQDVSGAATPEQVSRALDLEGFPVYGSNARKGEGVLDGIFTLVKTVLKQVREAGIDLGEPTEEMQTARPAKQGGREPRVTAAKEREDSAAVTRQSESSAAYFDAAQQSASAPVADEPIVEVDGGPEFVEGGRLRLPLIIRYGGTVKKVTLNVSLTPSVD